MVIIYSLAVLLAIIAIFVFYAILSSKQTDRCSKEILKNKKALVELAQTTTPDDFQRRFLEFCSSNPHFITPHARRDIKNTVRASMAEHMSKLCLKALDEKNSKKSCIAVHDYMGAYELLEACNSSFYKEFSVDQKKALNDAEDDLHLKSSFRDWFGEIIKDNPSVHRVQTVDTPVTADIFCVK